MRMQTVAVSPFPHHYRAPDTLKIAGRAHPLLDIEPPVEELHGAAALYFLLRGISPYAAPTESAADFETHVFACVVAIAWSEAQGGNVSARLGLSSADLRELLRRYFPQVACMPTLGDVRAAEVDPDEFEMVQTLLEKHRSVRGKPGRWLVAIIARRALEPNHLWEDLGLRNRGELNRLMSRYFAFLATKNSKNMRWKRFFYRTMCEDDGLIMCTAPVCTVCTDFETCFGEETGESRLAQARLAMAAAR